MTETAGLREQLRTYFDALLEERAQGPVTPAPVVPTRQREHAHAGRWIALAAAVGLLAGAVSIVVAVRRDTGRQVDATRSGEYGGGDQTTDSTPGPLPDAGVVVAHSDGSIDLVNADDPTDVRPLAPAGSREDYHTEFEPGVALSPDGTTVGYETLDDQDRGMITLAPTSGHDGPTATFPGHDPAFSPDGRRLAYVFVNLVVRDLADGTERMWTPPALHYDESSGGRTGGVVWPPRWAADSRHVLTGYWDDGYWGDPIGRKTRLVDTEAPEGPLREFPLVPDGVRDFWGDEGALLAWRAGAVPPGTPGGTEEIVALATDATTVADGIVLFSIPEGRKDPSPRFIAADTKATRVLVALQHFPETEGGLWPPATVQVWSAATGLRQVASDVAAATWWEHRPQS